MILEDSVGAHGPELDSLSTLRNSSGPNCLPSEDSVAELQDSDTVLMSGQFVAAGKSTMIHPLVEAGRVNIASWTNRELRPGEVEGIDKVTSSLPEMARKTVSGDFLEIEEVRRGVFYATPANFVPGIRYVKDVELKGALRLREFAPELPIVIPLPPIYRVENKRVNEWERRLVVREGLDHSVTDKSTTELEGRLMGVIDESNRIEGLGLLDDPNTLIVVNDDLPTALSAMHSFLASRVKQQQEGLMAHIQGLRTVAAIALGHL